MSERQAYVPPARRQQQQQQQQQQQAPIQSLPITPTPTATPILSTKHTLLSHPTLTTQTQASSTLTPGTQPSKVFSTDVAMAAALADEINPSDVRMGAGRGRGGSRGRGRGRGRGGDASDVSDVSGNNSSGGGGGHSSGGGVQVTDYRRK